jgi:ribosomal protein S24E
MEINLPESQLKRPDIEISIRQESTRTVSNSSNIYGKIYRKLAALMQIDGKYILDCRYETDGNIAHIMTGVVPRLLKVK